MFLFFIFNVTWNKKTTKVKSLIYGQTFKKQGEKQKQNARLKIFI
jgi:hypothetical protein